MSRPQKYSNNCTYTNYYIPLTFYYQIYYTTRQEKVSPTFIHVCARIWIRNYHIHPSNEYLVEPPVAWLSNKHSELYKFHKVHCRVKNSTTKIRVSMNPVTVLYGPPEYHLLLYVPMSNKCHIPIWFLTIICMHFSFLTCLLRAPYNPLFDYRNSIWWMVEIVKPLLLQISLSHLRNVSKSYCVDGCIQLAIYKYVTQQYASIQLYTQKTCTSVTTVMSERCC